jgi:hypothetical protein
MFAEMNYQLMLFVSQYYSLFWAVIFFTGSLLSMSPLSTNHEHRFHTHIFVMVRKLLITAGLFGFALLPIIYGFYDVADHHKAVIISWILHVCAKSLIVIISSTMIGMCIRLSYTRYFLPTYSNFLKSVRVNQNSELATDIRDEAKKLHSKDFLPSKYYKDGEMFLGLDSSNKPIYIPQSTWYEVNMQVIGATRYGKGIVFGCLMEQSILKGDAVFY